MEAAETVHRPPTRPIHSQPPVRRCAIRLPRGVFLSEAPTCSARSVILRCRLSRNFVSNLIIYGSFFFAGWRFPALSAIGDYYAL